MIVKRHLNNISSMTKLNSVKNLGAHFTLEITTNQDLEPMLGEVGVLRGRLSPEKIKYLEYGYHVNIPS